MESHLNRHRIWYTPTLRRYDAGNVVFGMNVNPLRLFMPQGIVSTLTGYCHADCTEDFFPEEGITAFGSVLHAHLAGTAISLRHIRDGVELEPLDVNEHYDFNYQQMHMFDEPRTLLPGDQFMVQCTYDTSDRDELVLGGLKSSFVIQ